MFQYPLTFSLAATFCIILTPWVMRLADILGAIDRPDIRRVHSTPTPRLGGLAVLASVTLAIAADLMIGVSSRPEEQDLLVLLVAGSVVMLLGLVDDCFSLSASVKVIVEMAVALATFAYGYRISRVMGRDLGWVAVPATVAWILALTNAFNLIDGLDGLATGIGAIISATLFALCIYDSQVFSALVLAGLCGSLFAFLRYNFFPARIFLGDSGSLFLGFVFALVSIRMADKSSAALAISIPLLALGLPLGEMVLTILRRTLRVVHVIRGGVDGRRYEFFFLGRTAVFTADKSHIHHRLIELGLDHRSAVLFLYSVCSLCCGGALALIFRRGGQEALILGTFAVAAIIGIRRLGYKELQPLRNGIFLPLLDAPIFNLRSFQVLLDIASIAVAYLSSYLLWSHAVSTALLTPAVLHALPLVCFVQIAAFAASGLYHRSHRLSDIEDLLALLRALSAAALVGWGAAFVVAGLGLAGLAVAVLDTYILATLVISWRFSFALLEHYFHIDSASHDPPAILNPELAQKRSANRSVSSPFERLVNQLPIRRGNGL